MESLQVLESERPEFKPTSATFQACEFGKFGALNFPIYIVAKITGYCENQENTIFFNFRTSIII